MSQVTDAAIEAAFRDEWGRVVAALIRRTGNWDLAEECAADAFAQAHLRWDRDGIPAHPGAWLTTVAGNRALDRLRRAKRGTALLEQLGRDPLQQDAEVKEMGSEGDAYEDDRLRLIFTCCHPALSLDAQVALTLRCLCGLSIAEIAHAFVVQESTLAKRLTRAKAKITAASIPFKVPPKSLLPERLPCVLAVIYLLFNEGYLASFGTTMIRTDLCGESIRLAHMVVRLLPGESEATGLLALLLLTDARRAAREVSDGDLLTLEEQDRSLWDGGQIAEAAAMLAAGMHEGQVGPYQLQAAIAECHSQATKAANTDWARIAHLYSLLEAVAGGPIIRLNKAVAVAMAGSIDDGLAIIDEIEREGRLDGYHLLPATRADFLRRRGDGAGAAASYERALQLVTSESEKRFLTKRLNELRPEPR